MQLLFKNIILCSLFLVLFVQPTTGQNAEHIKEDKNKFFSFLKEGHFKGHIRNHFMTTINSHELTDYYTNATGGALKYETGKIYGFYGGVEGIFTYGTIKDNVLKEDPITGKISKWELELYDYTRPGEERDLDRLQELYIGYSFKNSYIEYGKVDINKGPLFLKRDSRMKPFAYRGFWGQIKEIPETNIYTGFINGVSPRGVTEWYSINEAIGINNNGFEPDGSKADYHGFSETKGIAVLGAENESFKNFTFKFWDFWMHNMNNTLWFQIDYKDESYFAGAQYVFQHNTGQNELAYNERYFQPDQTANVISLNAGKKIKDHHFSFSYLHAFGTGRFLYPRELGREDFYVSQPRSWIDGFGDLDVYMLRYKWKIKPLKDLLFDWRLSYTETAGIDNYEFNKYGLPSFYQSTILLRHKCKNKLEGLKFSLLYLYKYSPEDMELSKRFYLSDFHHISFISQIDF